MTERPTAPPHGFVVLSTGQCLSSVGTWMQKTGMGWLAWDLTHSVAWVGAIALADLIAALWVAPLAGAVSDRSNPYHLLRTTQTLMLLVSLLLWWTCASGHLGIGLLMAFAVINATLQGFNQPAHMLITGILAGPQRMSQAIATNSIAFNLARIIGPALAGLLMVSGDVALVFLANSLSFAAMLLALYYLRRWIDAPGLAGKGPLVDDIGAGFNYIRRTPRIAALFALVVGFSVLARPFAELFPALAGQIFQGGPATLSTLMSAQGVGALAGALWMLRQRETATLVRVTVGSALGLVLALVALACTRDLVVGAAVVVAAGGFHVVCNIGMQSMAQLSAEPHMRGRVMAMYGLVFRAGPAVGAFTIGLAAHLLPLPSLLAAAALLFGAMTLTFLPRARRAWASH